MNKPGIVAFIGSGETSALGGQVYDLLARDAMKPLRAAVLETPAGFELNSSQVAGRVAEFLARRLQNDHPEVFLVPARRKGTPLSPDEAEVVEPLYQAGLIFLGPGSPTYAARQLLGSLAWEILRARHQVGAAIAFASAAVLAAGSFTLPVYEIYKAGHDPFWAPGLGFLAPYGLNLAFIPHWNNSDGGADLDTSCCFIGRERFEPLRKQLPVEATVVGIDEHTALILDLDKGQAKVLGRGSVHVLQGAVQKKFQADAGFEIEEMGRVTIPSAGTGISPEIYQRAAQENSQPVQDDPTPPPDVLALLAARDAARMAKNWTEADHLRQQIDELGWAVKDTPLGSMLEPLN